MLTFILNWKFLTFKRVKIKHKTDKFLTKEEYQSLEEECKKQNPLVINLLKEYVKKFANPKNDEELEIFVKLLTLHKKYFKEKT